MRIRVVPAWIRAAFCRGIGLALCVFCIGCATAQHAGERGLSEKEGMASYYADKFVGRTTANGEIYDHGDLTAAHPSLPFGTRLRVTRIDHVDEPSVVVRINDRGPFHRGRVVDLSKTAARRLEMIPQGVVEVQLEVVSYPPETETASSDAAAPRAGW